MNAVVSVAMREFRRLGDAAVEPGDPPAPAFEAFITDASLRLRRSLVARYGVELGVDACSEAIAWAWANRDRLLGMRNPVGYLYRVGQTAVRTQVRRQRVPDLPVELPEGGIEVPDPGLQAALAQLSHEQRAALMLVHAYGYSYAEAAVMLDVPITTLKNHLSRGGKKLRRILERLL
jgi:DNA-directed RNA polymerase specialized sigma24 family protein